MLRHSFKRSQRSQGFKVKHALQLFLLVSVSVWLIYQVHHSRGKSAYEEATRVAKETLKLGRKDLLPSMADPIILEVNHKVDDRQHKIVDNSDPRVTETRTTVLDGSVHDRETRGSGEETTESKEKKEEHEHQIDTGSEEKVTHETEGEARESEEEKEERDGKTDEAVVEHCGDTEIPEMGENKVHDEFVRWSNTNSTEAYIHQEERDTNMIKDDETNNTLSSSDSFELNNSTDSAADEGNAQNSTVTEIATCGESSSDIDMIESIANATLSSEATLLGTESVKSNASAEAGEDDGDDVLQSNSSKNNTEDARSARIQDSSVSKEKDESSGGDGDVQTLKEEGEINNCGDDVQKLKEEVDYSSVSRKEDESSGETESYNPNHNTTGSSRGEQGFREDTEESLATENDSSDASIHREEKDSRTNLQTLPGSLTGGGNTNRE